MTRLNLVKASFNPLLFKIYRKYLYLRFRDTEFFSQGEIIHEHSKKHLLFLANSFKKHSYYFNPGKQVHLKINNHKFFSPVGLASGFDKNCELLMPASYIFGLVTVGTILKNKNNGNFQDPKKGIKRLIVDHNNHSIINSQGYPSLGLDYCILKLKQFQNRNKGNARIILSFSGISSNNNEDNFLESCNEIIKTTHSYVDGFEDSRSSPNTEFNQKIQTRDFTKHIMNMLNSHAPSKIKISKISPYSIIPTNNNEFKNKIDLAKTFYDNGGDAIVVNNTQIRNTSNHKIIENFHRNKAGISGKPLFPYTLKLVKDIHEKIPPLTIIGCGGIFSGRDAWELIQNGASLIELYTGLTFKGFSLVREINNTIKIHLKNDSLQNYLDKRDSIIS